VNWGNPIILKEGIQAANHKRLFLVRVALPAAAILLVAPEVISTLNRVGQDWRAIADFSRSFFNTVVWLELVAFSLLAFVYATGTIQSEWTNRTIEVLCASPLGAARIIYGKFFVVLGKVMLAVLALAPALGIIYQLGRMPREIAVGAQEVVAGSVLVFASIAVFQAAMFRPQKIEQIGVVALVLPYFLVLTILDGFVYVGHPVLEAMIPVRALYLVMEGRAPGGMAVETFAALSLGISAAVSLCLLAAAPAVFKRTFAKYIGGREGMQRGGALFRPLGRRRGPLGEHENPLTWQERGKQTWLLKWGLWIVYAITFVFAFFISMYSSSESNLFESSEFYIFLGFEGIFAIILLSLLYGATVFAREKSRRSADALILTGRSAGQFYFSKIAAAYGALVLPLSAVSLCFVFGGIFRGSMESMDNTILILACGAAFVIALATIFMRGSEGRLRKVLLGGDPPRSIIASHRTAGRLRNVLLWVRSAFTAVLVICAGCSLWGEEKIVACIASELLLFGPLLGVVVGMAFSAAARSVGRAVLGLASAVGWGFMLGWVMAMFDMGLRFMFREGGFAALFALCAGGLFIFTRKWTPVRLGLLLAMTFFVWLFGTMWLADNYTVYSEWHGLAAGTLLAGTALGFWLMLGVRNFEAGICDDPARRRVSPYKAKGGVHVIGFIFVLASIWASLLVRGGASEFTFMAQTALFVATPLALGVLGWFGRRRASLLAANIWAAVIIAVRIFMPAAVVASLLRWENGAFARSFARFGSWRFWGFILLCAAAYGAGIVLAKRVGKKG